MAFGWSKLYTEIFCFELFKSTICGDIGPTISAKLLLPGVLRCGFCLYGSEAFNTELPNVWL